MTAARSARPVALLVHGLGSSHRSTWTDSGWDDLLDDAGLDVAAFELPGHGRSSLPARTSAAEAAEVLVDALPEARTGMGFSAGGLLLLHAATAASDRFERLLLLGVGDGMWLPPTKRAAFADRLRDADDDDEDRAVLRTMSRRAGNDIAHVADYLEASGPPPPLDSIGAITAEVLIVVGDRDSVAPAQRLVAALPRARAVTVPGLDHYRTPRSPAVMAIVAEWLSH